MDAKSKRPRICQICGDVAKSMHFGGLCCDSCKAFFRRSVQSDGFRNFKCSGDKRCSISIASRKFCKLCRFNKCEKVGMVREWVMSEEERIQLMKSRLNKKDEATTSELNSCAVDAALVNSYKGRVALTASGAPNLHGLNRRRHMEYRRREIDEGEEQTTCVGEDRNDAPERDRSVNKKLLLEPGEVDPGLYRINNKLEPGQVDHTLYRKPRKKNNIAAKGIPKPGCKEDEAAVEVEPEDDDKSLEKEAACIVEVEPQTKMSTSYFCKKRKQKSNSYSFDKTAWRSSSESPSCSEYEAKSCQDSSKKALLGEPNLFEKNTEYKSLDYYEVAAVQNTAGSSLTCRSPSSDEGGTSPQFVENRRTSPDCRRNILLNRRHPGSSDSLKISCLALEPQSLCKSSLNSNSGLGSAGNSLPNSPSSPDDDCKADDVNASLTDSSDFSVCPDDSSNDQSLNSFPRDPYKYAIMINERPGLPITNYMQNHELYKLKAVVRSIQRVEHCLPYPSEASTCVMSTYSHFIKRVSFFLDQFEEFSSMPIADQSIAIESNITAIALVFGSSFLDGRSGAYKNFLPSPMEKVTDMPAIEATLTPNIFRKFQEVIGVLGQFQVDIRMGYMVILIIVLSRRNDPNHHCFYRKLLYNYICWKYGEANAEHINKHLFKAIAGIKQHSGIFESMCAKPDRRDSFDEEGFSKRIKTESPDDDLQPSLSFMSDTIPYQMGDIPSGAAAPDINVLRDMFFSGASREELCNYYYHGTSNTDVKTEPFSSDYEAFCPTSSSSVLQDVITNNNSQKDHFELGVCNYTDSSTITSLEDLKVPPHTVDLSDTSNPLNLASYGEHASLIEQYGTFFNKNMAESVNQLSMADSSQLPIAESTSQLTITDTTSQHPIDESMSQLPINFSNRLRSSDGSSMQEIIAKHGADKLRDLYLAGDMASLKSMFTSASSTSLTPTGIDVPVPVNSAHNYPISAISNQGVHFLDQIANLEETRSNLSVSDLKPNMNTQYNLGRSCSLSPSLRSHQETRMPQKFSAQGFSMGHLQESYDVPTPRPTKASYVPVPHSFYSPQSTYDPTPPHSAKDSYDHIPARLSSPLPAHAKFGSSKDILSSMSSFQFSTPSSAAASNFSASMKRNSLGRNSFSAKSDDVTTTKSCNKNDNLLVSGLTSEIDLSFKGLNSLDLSLSRLSPGKDLSRTGMSTGRDSVSGLNSKGVLPGSGLIAGRDQPLSGLSSDKDFQPYSSTVGVEPNIISPRHSPERLKDLERSHFNPSNYLD
ncbi:uncharacterized protein LOC108672557 [Hyalella azteca]|uniref:Uncharacterized protein LOC108672557 n=1 Tax=Hyalella azteca TaxID=294128 RepID=A0A8B7NPX6_HYAAZ|nr:uncharacterized protein LOC108672557 [Hyalella azteca]